jgi:hypothetical protein
MLYEDHQNLESAYDKVLLKEGQEILNMNVGQDPREAYPEKFDEEESEPEDVFKKSLNEIYQILDSKVDHEVLYTINKIMQRLYVAAFSEGQHRGKETWKN